MRRMIFNAPIALLLLQAVEPRDTEQACLPCGGVGHPGVASVRDHLEEAFSLSMTVPDCYGAENLQTCRDIEGLLDNAFETLDAVVTEGGAGGSIDCLSCDPRPHLSPLFSGFETLAILLVDRGYAEFVGRQTTMQQEVELWKGYRCCGEGRGRAPARGNRESDARAMLVEKCGVNFEKNRSGLKQVVRMPGDRAGCFQSRACRDATQHNGQYMEAGFWTYDGEYWYIWERRRTPRGDWVDCNP